MQNTPVSDLLKSTTTEVVQESPHQSQRSSEELNEQLFKVEGLIQSLIINQQTMMNYIQDQKRIAPPIKEDKKKSQISLVSGLFIGLIISLMILLAFEINDLKNASQVTQNTENKVKNIQKSQFFIQKYINLRDKPSTNSKILTVLAPNSLISVTKKDNNWSLVSFRNHLENKIYEGWIWGDSYKEVFSEARLNN